MTPEIFGKYNLTIKLYNISEEKFKFSIKDKNKLRIFLSSQLRNSQSYMTKLIFFQILKNEN